MTNQVIETLYHKKPSEVLTCYFRGVDDPCGGFCRIDSWENFWTDLYEFKPHDCDVVIIATPNGSEVEMWFGTA